MNKETLQNSRRRSGSSTDTSEILLKKIKTETNLNVDQNFKSGKHNLSSSGIFCNFYAKLLFPSHFRSIIDIFVSLDNVVNKLIYNQEILYMDRISECLKQMNKKIFDREIFGQILTIFPESYSYEFHEPSRIIQDDILILIPNLTFGKKQIDCSPSPRKIQKGFSLSQLLMRRNCLEDRLLKLVEEKHEDFLINVKKLPKCVTEYQKKPVAWHPEFDLEKSVDKIPSSSLDHLKVSTDKTKLSRRSWHSCLARKSMDEICKNLFNDGTVTAVEESIKTKPKFLEKKSMKQLCLSFPSVAQDNQMKSDQEHQEKVKESEESSSIKTELSQKRKLPFHLKILFELFIGLDRAVRDTYCKKELCFLTKISPNVSMKRNFCQAHLGKIIRIYPESYSLRWERSPAKSSTKMDLVIKPNLRHDGTKSASLSSDCGFLKFDFTQLKERRQLFLDKCEDLVITGYTTFLTEKLCLTKDESENIIKENYWDRRFNVDLHVKMVESADMPAKPGVKSEETKELSTISEFLEIVKKKRTVTKKVKADPNLICVVPSKSEDEKLINVDQDFLTNIKLSKVKEEGLLNHEIDYRPDRSTMLASEFPEMIKIIESEFKNKSYKIIDRSHLKTLICRSIPSLTEKKFDEYLDTLIQLVPDWIETTPDWSRPLLGIRNDRQHLTAVDIIKMLNTTITDRLKRTGTL